MQIFTEIESQKAQILTQISDWPEARVTFRPAAGEWSVVEMLDHIVRTEVEIQAAAKRGLLAPHKLSVRDRLGFAFLHWVFRSERKVKVPSAARSVLPAGDVTLAGVMDRWDVTRKDLAQLLSETKSDQLTRGVFRHPVSGWMTLPQVLQFFSVHIRHHEFQLARLRAASAAL